MHLGHKSLLKKAFNISEEIIIGLTTDKKANELRVKEQLKADQNKAPKDRQSPGTIIANSSSVPGLSLIRDPSYTKAELNKLVPKDIEEDDEVLKSTLLRNLNKLKVHLFALDPVPGGNFKKVARIGWQEEKHFYTLPEFVVKKIT